jgi:hypothetical protein
MSKKIKLTIGVAVILGLIGLVVSANPVRSFSRATSRTLSIRSSMWNRIGSSSRRGSFTSMISQASIALGKGLARDFPNCVYRDPMILLR